MQDLLTNNTIPFARLIRLKRPTSQVHLIFLHQHYSSATNLFFSITHSIHNSQLMNIPSGLWFSFCFINSFTVKQNTKD